MYCTGSHSVVSFRICVHDQYAAVTVNAKLMTIAATTMSRCAWILWCRMIVSRSSQKAVKGSVAVKVRENAKVLRVMKKDIHTKSTPRYFVTLCVSLSSITLVCARVCM